MQIDSVSLYVYSPSLRRLGEKLIISWFYDVLSDHSLAHSHTSMLQSTQYSKKESEVRVAN
jgi:hypothetical protein